MTQFKKAKSKLMKATKEFFADESAQGMTEYILLLVAIIAIAMLFKKQITAAVESKVNDVGDKIKDF